MTKIAATARGDARRAVVQAATEEFRDLLTAGDPEAVAIYRRHQEESLGADPLAEGACDWPAELGQPGGVVDVPATAPLLGWRMWAVHHSRLVAPFVYGSWKLDPRTPGVEWRPGTNTVSARWCRGTGSHPLPGCRCGIRAVQSRTVLDRFAIIMEERLGSPGAIAQVAVWGRVASFAPDDDWMHTLRAQHARIVGPVALAPEHESRRDSLARRYRVDVTVLPDVR